MSNAQQTKRVSSFTMIEIMIVIVIIGVLGALALSSYRIQTLKIKNQEAARALMVLWGAQKDYYRTNNAYAVDILNLDIEIGPLENFTSLSAVDGTPDSCGAGPATPVLASAVSAQGYTLHVLEDGRIVCKPCGDARCAQMGFPAW